MISLCAEACSCDGGTAHDIQKEDDDKVDGRLKDTASEERTERIRNLEENMVYGS